MGKGCSALPFLEAHQAELALPSTASASSSPDYSGRCVTAFVDSSCSCL